VSPVSTDSSPQERKATLLESADIRAWIKDHRSASTGQLQFEQLELLCRRTGTSPDEFARLGSAKPNKEFRRIVVGWVASERSAGRPDQYLNASWYALKSWLRFNEVAVEWSPPLSVEPAETLVNERVPTQPELRRLLSVLSTRDRAAVLVLATSGVRIGVLANRFEAAGLTLRSLPDLEIGAKTVQFRKTPALVQVPASLSKTKKAYSTFITAEAAESVVAYLQQRCGNGERLSLDSALIGPERRASHAHFRRGREDSLFISGKSLGNVIRLGLRKILPAGVRVRPHTLRAWTSTQLELAERQGKITRSVREYFLGHNLGSVELRYNLGKKLSPESIEALRGVYAGCEPFLSTVPPARDSGMDDLLRIIAEKAGISGEAMAGKSTTELADEVIRLLREERGPGVPTPATVSRQRAVATGEVDALLQQGWRFVSPLGAERAVLEAPGSAPPSAE
jgi:integrase